MNPANVRALKPLVFLVLALAACSCTPTPRSATMSGTFEATKGEKKWQLVFRDDGTAMYSDGMETQSGQTEVTYSISGEHVTLRFRPGQVPHERRFRMDSNGIHGEDDDTRDLEFKVVGDAPPLPPPAGDGSQD